RGGARRSDRREDQRGRWSDVQLHAADRQGRRGMSSLTPRVFVVDDDASVRKSLTRLLSSAGYEVETFRSSAEFLTRTSHEGPCCLLLDVQMPGLSEIDLQSPLPAAGRRLSIVFLTGHADVPMSVAAMKRGAVDLLTK